MRTVVLHLASPSLCSSLSILMQLIYLLSHNFIMKRQLLFLLWATIIHCAWMDITITNDGTTLDSFFPNNVDAYRATIIQDNVRMVREHNADPKATFKMEPYPMFVGLTLEQAKARYFSTQIQANFDKIKVEGKKAPSVDGNSLKATASIDLSQIFVTPVNNQGACGNCYAYATTDAINLVNKRNKNGIPLLSPQDLTDCSTQIGVSGYRNLGCNGGNLYISYEYVRSYGLNSLGTYPISSDTVYNRNPQPCRYSGNKYRIRTWAYFVDTNCFSRMNVLLSGYAVTIAVMGGNNNFMYYRGGILSGCGAGAQLDHAVTLVGLNYNSNNPGISYFKIKNSWGTGWGESGFSRVNIGQCGTCSDGVFMLQ